MTRKAVIIFLSLFLARDLFAQNSSEPQIVIDPSQRSFPVGEEVKIRRAEKRKKMPYLDRRYVKETINRKTIEAQFAFTQKEAKTLDAAIARSIEASTTIQASKERIALARRKILLAARELLPSFDFSFELPVGNLSGDPFSGRKYHSLFKLPLFRGGILWNTLRMENARYQSARKEYEAVTNELVDEVSKAYFEYNRAQEVYSEKKALAEGAKRQYEISRQKFQGALISEIEYLNVESMSGQLQYEVETAQQELELAQLELLRFLHLDYDEKIEIMPLYLVDQLIEKANPKAQKEEAKAEENLALKQTLEEFIDLAYRNRPDLQGEAAKMRASRLEEQIYRGSFLPRVDLTMEFGKLGEAFTRIAGEPATSREWRLGLELSQNLAGNKVKYTFDNDENAPSISQFLQGTGSRVISRKLEVGALNGLQDYVDLKEAQVKKLEQVIELEKKEQKVIREVKEAYFDYHKAEIQVQSSLKRNQYRARLVELSRLKLEKAETEISDYLQAQFDLSEERKKLHGALADLFKAKSKLNRAIGIRNYLPMEERYGV